MGAVVVGLVVLVVWLASKSPTPGQGSGMLTSDVNVPALGATDKFSPALTGGMPLISKANRTRLATTYRDVSPIRTVAMSDTPPAGSDFGILGGLTNDNNDGGYARQTTPPKVQYTDETPVSDQSFKF